MWTSIISALITGGVTLLGVVFSNNKNQAVIEERVNELTREVRLHNEFARRIPVVEEKIENIEKRVSKLENK